MGFILAVIGFIGLMVAFYNEVTTVRWIGFGFFVFSLLTVIILHVLGVLTGKDFLDD